MNLQYFPQENASQPLTYLDSSGSTLTLTSVIEVMTEYYTSYRANTHSGLYSWSYKATQKCRESREIIAKNLNCHPEEIIFTRGATDGLNMIAEWMRSRLFSENSIVLSVAEHHSNLLPWQQLSHQTGSSLRYAGLDQGAVDTQEMCDQIDDTTAIVAVTQVSNVLGSITNLSSIIKKAKKHNALVIVDGCQALAHLPIDLADLGADFYIFSGHKVYGPTGIGVLYGRYDLLQKMPPLRTGGAMISEVTLDSFTPAPIPDRFEPGTLPIAEIIGLGQAMSWINQQYKIIQNQEYHLINSILTKCQERPWIHTIGPETTDNRIGCFSFHIEGLHPHDITYLLAQKNIAVRGGHHCAQPLINVYDIPGSTRVSLGIYNTEEDIDSFFTVLDEIYELFRQR